MCCGCLTEQDRRAKCIDQWWGIIYRHGTLTCTWPWSIFQGQRLSLIAGEGYVFVPPNHKQAAFYFFCAKFEAAGRFFLEKRSKIKQCSPPMPESHFTFWKALSWTYACTWKLILLSYYPVLQTMCLNMRMINKKTLKLYLSKYYSLPDSLQQIIVLYPQHSIGY